MCLGESSYFSSDNAKERKANHSMNLSSDFSVLKEIKYSLWCFFLLDVMHCCNFPSEWQRIYVQFMIDHKQFIPFLWPYCLYIILFYLSL